MDLTINDVADLLNVSETTIKRWLKEEKIPSYQINEQYRFSRTEIEGWVIARESGKENVQHKPHSSQQHTQDQSTDHHIGNKQFSLYRAIHKGTVLIDVPGNTKEEVIRATMQKIAKEINLDADVLTELLLDRERLQPTALNHGIGIPHTRDFLLNAFHDVVTVVFPKKPLDYGALDGKPVHSLFFLFACDDKRHLHLLAKIAHLSSQSEALDFLKTKPSKEALLAYIKEWESLA